MNRSKRPPVAMMFVLAAVPPGQPAATLRPDALDAPAATSVMEARRAAELAREMAGHAAHGAGTYRQLDAGRDGETTPQHQHHHATPPATPPEDEEHTHEPPAAARRQA